MAGEISVLGKEGDTKIVWDAENEDEVEHAKESFDAAMKKEWTAFRVNKKGEKAKKITKFDPYAERIILVPRVAGG